MGELTTKTDFGKIENVLINGDLARLSDGERTSYYKNVCESLGLNPLTQPFSYIELNGKLTLYAKKDCTEQLRKVHKISLEIVSRDKVGEVFVVTARATDSSGRSDESTGAVPLVKEDGEWQSYKDKRFFKKNGKIIPLNPDEMANAMMKAETKAKRRVTLSLCGLGLLDETEVETIKDAEPIQADPVNPEVVEALECLEGSETSDIEQLGKFEITWGKKYNGWKIEDFEADQLHGYANWFEGQLNSKEKSGETIDAKWREFIWTARTYLEHQPKAS